MICVMFSDNQSSVAKIRPAGEDVSLPCHVRDGAHVRWLRGGLELLPANGDVPPHLHGQFSVKVRGRNEQELLLLNVTVNDSNVYTCVDGSVHHIFNLTVLGINILFCQ